MEQQWHALTSIIVKTVEVKHEAAGPVELVTKEIIEIPVLTNVSGSK